MVQTKTTPKPSKPDAIHPLTPAQTHEPPSLSAAAALPLSAPLRRRRSLRLASLSDPLPGRDRRFRR
ncbi:hypothetical protein E2542_SST01608 [Spatholobus suberectus]|nr:hypothetical protein E2542_SST01608 [Spatholobus suberectus]